MPITGVSIVSVPVSDPERARDFYTGVLGFDVLEDEVMGEAMRWIRVAPPGTGTSLTLVTWFESMPAGSLKGLVMGVDDIDAVAADLEDKGVATANGVESAPWGRFVQIDDPDGNGIVLQQAVG
jgi:catechol 2,3-dioxygenase-like lactoylglutathione lyase family enzyme